MIDLNLTVGDLGSQEAVRGQLSPITLTVTITNPDSRAVAMVGENATNYVITGWVSDVDMAVDGASNTLGLDPLNLTATDPFVYQVEGSAVFILSVDIRRFAIE